MLVNKRATRTRGMELKIERERERERARIRNKKHRWKVITGNGGFEGWDFDNRTANRIN